MIEIKKVNYFYKSNSGEKIHALKNINIEIREGEYVAIMGHNSSGKTTLVRCLNGLLVPKEGQIFVDTLDIHDEKNILAIRKKVGMVFQNPDNQLVATTVEREIAFGLENLGVPSDLIHKVVDATLEKFNLTKYRKYPPHLLSGGEKQRVALASILAMNPKYIVLDEPTSMLDPRGRRELLDLLDFIKSDNNNKKITEQITIILITQFPEEALRADRLIVMQKGETIFDDQPKWIFQNVEKLKDAGLDVPAEFELMPYFLDHGISSELLHDFDK